MKLPIQKASKIGVWALEKDYEPASPVRKVKGWFEFVALRHKALEEYGGFSIFRCLIDSGLLLRLYCRMSVLLFTVTSPSYSTLNTMRLFPWETLSEYAAMLSDLFFEFQFMNFGPIEQLQNNK